MKKRVGKEKVIRTALPGIRGTGELTIEPIAVSDRIVKRGNKPVTNLLIQWTNGTAEKATWEF